MNTQIESPTTSMFDFTFCRESNLRSHARVCMMDSYASLTSRQVKGHYPLHSPLEHLLRVRRSGARTHRCLHIVGIPPKGFHSAKTLLLRENEVVKFHVTRRDRIQNTTWDLEWAQPILLEGEFPRSTWLRPE